MTFKVGDKIGNHGNCSTYAEYFKLVEDKMTISVDKEYTTKDGLPVRIYAVDGNGDFPVHGAVFGGGYWLPESYKANGQHSHNPSNSDLIEVPRTVERWVLVRDDGFVDSNLYDSKQDALEYTAFSKAIKITIQLDGES